MAARLCDALSRRGKSVFVDVGERLGPGGAAKGAASGADERSRAEIAGIPPSAPWMEEIRSAIAAADMVLVIVSPDSCASRVCRAELECAVVLEADLDRCVGGAFWAASGQSTLCAYSCWPKPLCRLCAMSEPP